MDTKLTKAFGKKVLDLRVRELKSDFASIMREIVGVLGDLDVRVGNRKIKGATSVSLFDIIEICTILDGLRHLGRIVPIERGGKHDEDLFEALVSGSGGLRFKDDAIGFVRRNADRSLSEALSGYLLPTSVSDLGRIISEYVSSKNEDALSYALADVISKECSLNK